MIYHIALPADWAAAQAAGVYEVSTRGATLTEQGFIHCSQRHQVLPVAEAFYSDLDELLLLTIDPARLDAPVRYEAPGPGAEPHPHIYGPLLLPAVVDVHPLQRAGSGRFILPGTV